ncbi:MAG: hypothetical protein NTU91_02450 [Chloroflexi bacterium]|nr:hypothetical protein [Chloroflexota bacterium]
MVPLIAGLILLVALLVWELWICEGAHFGQRFVVAMYNLAADHYDSIKHFDADWERRFLGEALAGAMGSMPGVRLLDVGAGTGRAARAWLLITNRVSRDARWIFGRTVPRKEFAPFLESAGLNDIEVLPWQVDYDLAWARKP